MILILCHDCSFGLRVMGDPEEVDTLVGPSSELWSEGFRCPDCEKTAKGYLETDVEAEVLLVTRLVDVTPQEAYAACQGLGLPNEQNCTVEALSEILHTATLKKVHGKNIRGTTRCTINMLEFVDGTRVFFGAGAAGACVYRIVPPHSYVEALNGS